MQRSDYNVYGGKVTGGRHLDKQPSPAITGINSFHYNELFYPSAAWRTGRGP